MFLFVIAHRARQVGLLVFFSLSVLLTGELHGQADDATALDQASPDAGSAGSDAIAVRTAPAELPPTQESIRRRKMSAQIKIEGENRFRYARELEADGYLTRARQLLEDFLVLYPEHDRRFAALEMLARIEEQQDRPERAVAAYRRAFQSVPGEDRGLEAALRAGRILAGLGRVQEARRLFQEIQSRKPDSRIARLVDIELQALGLPLIDDGGGRGQPSGNDPAPDDEMGQSTGSSDVDSTEAAPNRGLLDGTDGVPTNGGRSGDAAVDAGKMSKSQQNSGAQTKNQSQMESSSRQPPAEALQRMGEGVEQLPDLDP